MVSHRRVLILFALKFFASVLLRRGHREFVSKSAGKQSFVRSSSEEQQRKANLKAIAEENLVGELRSNGEIESIVQEVEGLMRSASSDWEHKLGTRIARNHYNSFLITAADSGWRERWTRSGKETNGQEVETT